MIGSFYFKGINSKDMGIYISGSGTFNAPERDIQRVEIPGKDGELLIDNKRFKNVIVTYPAFIRYKFKELTDLAREWLLKDTGYHRLEDTYHPDEFRKACFTGPLDFDVRFKNQSGECNISFNCLPQRFLKIGENVFRSPNEIKLYNPTGFPAKPRIRVYGTAGRLYAGNVVVQINAIDGYIDIDSETQNAYKDTVNCNKNINVSEFPTFLEGETGIRAEGNITSIEVQPRWWRI